jgi:hypothetical protein
MPFGRFISLGRVDPVWPDGSGRLWIVSDAVRALRAVPAAGAIIARPSLWATALRQTGRLAPRRWWARPPFLPWPAAEYLRFRLVTQYGDPAARPLAADVVTYLQWCRRWQRLGAP